jgi:cob(I)alamin adenosyltransferase
MIHVYAGDGKGKTTAVLGLALRACGWGKSVYLAQFLKSKDSLSGELKAICDHKLNIKCVRFDDQTHPIFLNKGQKFSSLAAKKSVGNGLKDIADYLIENKVDLLILDEILNALKGKILTLVQLKKFLKKTGKCEVVLTGRYLPKQVIALADYVSLIKKIKHPFDKKVLARKGIEF